MAGMVQFDSFIVSIIALLLRFGKAII